jgi:shikimate dehydrogenase
VLTAGPAGDEVRRAGVVGSPISHTLSPPLHRAAYQALGLTSWVFEVAEVGAGGLRGYVAQLPPEWVGLAVTMPLKEEALDLATQAGPAARLAGAANTLVRRGEGWYADNTDVHGLTRALTDAGLTDAARATVLGGGATARSAVVALHGLGVRELTFLVRTQLRPQTADLVRRLGADHRVLPLSDTPVLLDTRTTDVVVSTLPASVEHHDVVVPDGATAPVVLDVVYAPWPSRFAVAVHQASSGRVPVVRGTQMLLHQAVRQVELMTGHNGPVSAMRAVLETEGTGTA